MLALCHPGGARRDVVAFLLSVTDLTVLSFGETLRSNVVAVPAVRAFRPPVRHVIILTFPPNSSPRFWSERCLSLANR
ncbi:hypothetical protein ETAA8_63510 [Anatilimnocola aggregata]|uniref:Uncharacterized protein n=1 Tax=Anatilimnocola aggregata TaxID=2528021 RepID=A0A517YLV6_9BACT|nr:hypothetical protein ETAA8_63510 [Anatilimnocola aggregata]